MKTMSHKFILILSTIVSLNLLSQSKKVCIEEGNKAFKQQKHSLAIEWYLKVLEKEAELQTASVLPYEMEMTQQKHESVPGKNQKDATPDKSKVQTLKNISQEDNILLKLAHAYRLNSDDENALSRYKTCVDKNIPDARYYYAVTLMNLKKYREALNEFEMYIHSDSKNDALALLAQKKQAGCYMGLDNATEAREIKVKQPDTSIFNKGTSSFAASYYSDSKKIIFTGARKNGTTAHNKPADSEYLCDLYLTESKNGEWVTAINFGTPVNSPVHEGAAFMNDNEIYFTRWSDNNLNESFIYKSHKQKENYFEPQKLNENVNMKGYKSMHPFLSADGKKLFYSSNRPGGKGGFDIWCCNIDEKGMIGEPRNLGYPVNTTGDEVSPFWHEMSGKFYFSSNGLTGLGGLDVFKSDHPEDKVFSFPENLGTPVNSSKDDAYFILEKTGLSGMFSSDRAECAGGNCYKIYQFTSHPVKFDVSGVVFDLLTKEPIANAMVKIINVHNEAETYHIKTDDKGHYFAELKKGSEYYLSAKKDDYFDDNLSVITKDKTITTHFENTDFYLTYVPEGEVEIEGIEYDFNKATLRPVSIASLDKIADLLNSNTKLSIDIEANTDSRGNNDYNLKLSQARAQSCVDYLVSKGIDIKRLKPKGNGESNPLITDAQLKKLKPKSLEWEAAHQKNRRTALRFTGKSRINIINKGK